MLEYYSATELNTLIQYAISKKIKIEVGAKKLTSEKLEQFIEISSILKSRILRFVIDEDSYRPSIDQTVDIIKKHIPLLEKNSIYLTIENHDRFSCNQLSNIIEKCNSDFVKICLDTVNSFGAGEGIETVVKKLGHQTINLHVKEYSIKRIENNMGFTVTGKPLGEGQLPLHYVLSNIPFCKTIILEQWPPMISDNMEATIKQENDWAIKSIDYLKKLLKLEAANQTDLQSGSNHTISLT